jgi:lysophospholipase L1-like esterase
VLRNLLVAVLALVVSLVIAEGAVRGLRLAPEVTRIDIRTPWASFVPSDSAVLLYEPKPGSGDVNAYGVRDLPFDVAKRPGVFRIVVLGDSIAFGFCNDGEALPIESTFAKVLERNLRMRFRTRDIEVLNLAVSGYDTVQEAEFLARKGLALDPDLVLVSYCLNDAWQASAERIAFERSGLAKLMGRSDAFQRLYLSSHLLRFVLQRTQVLSAQRREKRAPAAAVDRTVQGFARIAQLEAEHGFATVVATFPAFESWAPYAREAEHAAVAQKAQDAGFASVDLLPAFRAESGGKFEVLQGRCNREHPDEYGHAVAARAIEAFLVEQQLVKR